MKILNSEAKDPRKKDLPPRPTGQRPEPDRRGTGAFGGGPFSMGFGNMQFSFGIGAFPFGFLNLNMNNGMPQTRANVSSYLGRD